MESVLYWESYSSDGVWGRDREDFDSLPTCSKDSGPESGLIFIFRKSLSQPRSPQVT